VREPEIEAAAQLRLWGFVFRVSSESARRGGARPLDGARSAGRDERTRSARYSLTSLQQCLVKIGGRLIKHARYYWFLLAESHLTGYLFSGMLQKIGALSSPAG